MPKRFTIGLLGFLAGVAGNLVAGWLQQGKWSILFTSGRLPGTLIGVVMILIIMALLESEFGLAWNWRWHRYWYLRELLKNPDLHRWETDFARLELVKGKRKISSTEVIAEGKRQDMVDVLREVITACHEKPCRALVLGEPGSGKTTGLERLTLDLARVGSRRMGIGCKIPLLIRLGNFQQGKLLDYVAQTMRHGSMGRSGKLLSKGIENEILLEKGHVVLLCDALDEALGERREGVLAELAGFLESRTYQNVPIVISSRTREDPGGRLKGLTFEIQDLSNNAVNAFIRVYKSPADADADIILRLQDHQLLDSSGLGRNPFWLKLIVESGAFGGNKAQILKTAVETLLAREWDAKPQSSRSWRRLLPRDQQLEETKRSLAFLGYWMSVGNLVTVEQDRAFMELTGWLKIREHAGIIGLRPQDILGLGRDAQVLVYEPGPIRFRHRLLQEFMTAYMLMVDSDLLEKKIDLFAQNLGWWETLFLLGGLLSSNSSLQAYSQLVQRVLEAGNNEQRLFAAVGLLRSAENPPAELTNLIMPFFHDLATMGGGLTDHQFVAAQELGRILGDRAAEIFGVLFRSPKRLIKIQGARLLCGIRGKRASEILLTALRNEKKHEVTPILIFINEEAIEILLIAALHDLNVDVRKRAVFAIGKIDVNLAIEPLIAALSGSDVFVRRNAAYALAEIGNSLTVEPFIVALRDSDSEVRKCVAEGLGKIGDIRAKESLLTASYEDKSDRVRKSIAEALRKIDDSRNIESISPGLGSLSWPVFDMTHDALIKVGKAAVKPLLTALRDPDSYVRRWGAASVLGKIGDKRAVEALIKALRDPEYMVQYWAADALGEIGDRRAIEPLLKALRDPFWFVRLSAAKALGKIGDQRAVEPLLKALQDKDRHVREKAAEALGEIGDVHAVGSLLTALRDSDEHVRWMAAGALGSIGDVRAVKPLIIALRDRDDRVRWTAAWALGELDDTRAIKPLIKTLRDSSTYVLELAVEALGKMGEPAIEALINALRLPHASTRKSAAKVLGKIGDSRALLELDRIAVEDKSKSHLSKAVVEAAREAADEIRQRLA